MNRIEYENTTLFKSGHFMFEEESTDGDVYVMGDIDHSQDWYLVKINNDGLRRCVAISSNIMDKDTHGRLLVKGVDLIE